MILIIIGLFTINVAVVLLHLSVKKEY